MSIWCSRPTIGFDDWETEEPQPSGGQVRTYATGWSNHYPTTDDTVEQEACVDLAHIAPWCVPGWEDSDGEDERGWLTGPWLRLTVDTKEHDYKDPRDLDKLTPVHASVVMDEAAVRALVADLTEWLDAPKAEPR